MLNIIFQHAPSYQRQVERLQEEHNRKDFLCHVDCILTHYPSGLVVGAGMRGGCTGEKRWVSKPVFDIYNSAIARINGQQLQTTDQDLGKRLLAAANHVVFATVEPAPNKPGKYYLKALDVPEVASADSDGDATLDDELDELS
jgi:hypothetical protein